MTTKPGVREGGFIAASLLIIALLFVVSYDVAIIVATIAVLTFGFLFRRRYQRAWIPAMAIPGAWILASGTMYEGYNVFRLTLFGLSIFPLLAWPMILMAAYFIIVPLFRISPWPKRWLVLAAFYCIGIVIMEWFGYNVLGIHLDRGREYEGWPVLDIFHCPVWMQVAYFGNGIFFMGAVSWLDRKEFDRETRGNSAVSTTSS